MYLCYKQLCQAPICHIVLDRSWQTKMQLRRTGQTLLLTVKNFEMKNIHIKFTYIYTDTFFSENFLTKF